MRMSAGGTNHGPVSVAGLSALERQSASIGTCPCDPSKLLPRVYELGDRLESNRSELLRLKHELRTAPPASPELLALASEGGILEQRAREGAALVARLRTENAALAWSVDCDRQRIRAFYKERQTLLQQLGDLEQSGRKLREAAREADLELGAERRQAEERTYGQETALGIIAGRASSAEQRWQEAEAYASRLRASAAEAESAAAATSRASLANAGERAREMCELQKALAQGNQEALQASGSNLRHAYEQVHSVQATCAELRKAEHILTEQVEDSQAKGAETEKRALQVARELVDSSQAIAWLQNEVAVQREAWAELEALRSHNEAARQRLQSSGSNEGINRAAAEPVVEANEPKLPMPELHAVSEALQLAWEGEAKEHRQAQLRLQSLEVLCLTPARQHLLQLAGLCKQWRQCLDQWRSGQVHDATSLAWKQEPSASLEDAAKQLRQRLAVEAAQDVCGSLESLAQQTVHWAFNIGRPGSVAELEPQRVAPDLSQSTPGPGLARRRTQILSASAHLQALGQETEGPEETSDAQSLTSSSLSVRARDTSFLHRSALPKARGRAAGSMTAGVALLPPARGDCMALGGTAGPLYRLEGGSPVFRPRRQLASSLSRLSLEFEDRFDEYSVHRPRQDGA